MKRGRVDNVFRDRNVMYSCVGMEAYPNSPTFYWPFSTC
jgi:hypothetical protein